MYLVVFLKGIIIGVFTSAPLGPAGLLCVNRTLRGGKPHGFATGLGAAVSDAVYASIAAFGLTMISDFVELHIQWFRLAGSLLLCCFGLYYFFKKPEKTISDRSKTTYAAHTLSGFLITFCNPLLIFIFVTLFATFGVRAASGGAASAEMLIAGIFCGACLWWFTLTTISDRFRDWFSHPNLVLAHRVVGAIFMILGVAGFVTFSQ